MIITVIFLIIKMLLFQNITKREHFILVTEQTKSSENYKPAHSFNSGAMYVLSN